MVLELVGCEGGEEKSKSLSIVKYFVLLNK